MRNNFADLSAQPKFLQKLDAGANADAVITITADKDQFWVIDWIFFSYVGGTVTGGLTVVAGTTTLLDVDFASVGAQQLRFDLAPLYNALQTKNEAVVITLKAGGSGVTGKLNARVR